MRNGATWRGAALLALATILLVPQFARADEERKVSNPAAGTPEHTVVRAIQAALDQDFDTYIALVDESEKPTNQAVQEIKRYSWARFVRQVDWYLESHKPITFIATKLQDMGDGTVKLFLKRIKKQPSMPAPVHLRKKGNGYTIITNSL